MTPEEIKVLYEVRDSVRSMDQLLKGYNGQSPGLLKQCEQQAANIVGIKEHQAATDTDIAAIKAKCKERCTGLTLPLNARTISIGAVIALGMLSVGVEKVTQIAAIIRAIWGG